MKNSTLTLEQLHAIDTYWRAANYPSVGQIYLYDNPLLKRPLTLADVKHMLLRPWDTTPGQNFVYVPLGTYLKQQLKDQLVAHNQYIDKYGEDLPEIRDWTWPPSSRPRPSERP
jgi:phosphoketolase